MFGLFYLEERFVGLFMPRKFTWVGKNGLRDRCAASAGRSALLRDILQLVRTNRQYGRWRKH
jgi:hypothetical protein